MSRERERGDREREREREGEEERERKRRAADLGRALARLNSTSALSLSRNNGFDYSHREYRELSAYHSARESNRRRADWPIRSRYSREINIARASPSCNYKIRGEEREGHRGSLSRGLDVIARCITAPLTGFPRYRRERNSSGTKGARSGGRLFTHTRAVPTGSPSDGRLEIFEII